MKKKDSGSAASDRMAGLCARFILKFQRWTMGRVQRAFERLPRSGRTAVLAVGFLAGAFLFGSLLLRPGARDNGVARAFRESKPPRPVPPDGAEMERQVLARIRRARRYLDSLAQAPGGGQRLDSILARHPGLRDSLALAEESLK